MATIIGGYNSKNKMIWNNDEGTKIVKDHVKNIRTKDKELRNIILQHPEIIFEEKAPDSEILFYILQSRKTDISGITKDQFKKEIPPISTIRNFRRKIILDLQKQGIFVINEVKLREKDVYIKEKYFQEGI